MKISSSRLLVAMMLILVTLASLTPAYAAGQSGLDLNYSGNFPGRLTAGGRTVRLEGIPASDDYRYIWLRLYTNGAEAFNETVQRDAGASATFTLTGVSSGNYELTIFHSAQEHSTYYSFISGDDVKITVTGDSIEFTEAEMYAHNEEMARVKREDIAALTYYLAPSGSIQSDDRLIQSQAAQIIEGITGSYDKAVAIHDWVCGNIYYDYDAYYERTPYGDSTAVGTLNSRRSVCEGYANLTAALLRAAGIPAKKITGFALGTSTDGTWPDGFDPDNNSNHAWNEAYVDGRWIIIDTTWDCDNAWEHGGIADSDGLRGHRYFDISPVFFAADHSIKEYGGSEIAAYVSRNARAATAYSGHLTVNGVFGLSAGLYNVDGSNYMKLRDAAAMLSGVYADFNIGWDAANGMITVESGARYQFKGGELSSDAPAKTATATLPTVTVSMDGEKLFLQAYNIGGSTYFRLRDLGTLFGFGVAANGATNTINIDLSGLMM